MNKDKTDISVDLNIDNSSALISLTEVKEKLETLRALTAEIDIPTISPIINFYNCSFNFGDKSNIDNHYYNENQTF